jgi:hypothetical protein
VPLCDGSDPRPHKTWHVGPVQLFTVQPVAGHVTLQSVLDPQSTEHDDAWAHSTWQGSPAAQPTLHGSPGAHWTSQALPPVVHAWLHGAASGQTQWSPSHTMSDEPQPARPVASARAMPVASPARMAMTA